MTRKISRGEDALKTDLNILSGEIAHELYVLCRKAGIYGVAHPLVRKAVSPPFMQMQKLFGFKQYCTIVRTQGRFFVNNIMLADSAAVDYLKIGMQDLDIHSLLFDESLTADHLLLFVDRFVRRLPATDPDFHMDKFLTRRSVSSIGIDGDLAVKLFETGLRYRGDVTEDFSVRRLVANYFLGEIELALAVLSGHYDTTIAQAAAVGIDYHRELVEYILPEKFAQMPPSEFLEAAGRVIDAACDDPIQAAGRLLQLVHACDYHPEREYLLEEIRKKVAAGGIDDTVIRQAQRFAPVGDFAKASDIDHLRNALFSDAFQPELYTSFQDAFIRLLRTRQTGKAGSIAAGLVEQLAASNDAWRQRAVYILERNIEAVLTVSEHAFLDVLLRHLQFLFNRHMGAFEFAEVAAHLLPVMIGLRRYEPVAQFLAALQVGRQRTGEVVSYDSPAIKKIFDRLDDRELIRRLVRELQQPANDQTKYIQQILVAVQSDGVALQLAEVVAHPERIVRQRCLKILAELGWPAVRVFTDILHQETNFLRPEGCRDLPNQQWFLIRNSIFVLGNLHDPHPCRAFRLRLNDPDVRVRLEIVKALEKIGGDEAIDLLMVLSDDNDTAVREAAIVTMGLLQREDLVPFYIDLMNRHKEEAARLITAIVATNSPSARDFLIHLLEDDQMAKAFASGKASSEEIRKLAVKALEKMTDPETQARLEEFRNKKAAHGISAGDLDIGKTARILFGKIQSKK